MAQVTTNSSLQTRFAALLVELAELQNPALITGNTYAGEASRDVQKAISAARDLLVKVEPLAARLQNTNPYNA
jgi:hypothetical protein